MSTISNLLWLLARATVGTSLYVLLCQSVSPLVSQSVRFCVSVRWVTLWVRPPPVKICVSVRWVTLWVRPPPCENMCVHSLGYIVGVSLPPL